MVGVELPGEDRLPAGPQRELALALHDLYRGAGRPPLRRIALEIRADSQYPDTVSHEAAGAMLRGQGTPRWSKLECLVRFLAVKHHPRLEPEEQVDRFLSLWNALSLPAIPPQGSGAPRIRVPDVTATRPGSAPVPAIVGFVPYTNMKFTGRADVLAEIDERWKAEPDSAKPLALYGAIGVGKTQIAVEYVRRRISDYDVIWWVNAGELSSMLESLAVLAVRLRVAEPEAASRSDVEDAAWLALEALRRGDPHKNWLLIFDNPDNPEDVLDLLPHGPGNILITSRSPRWRDRVGAIGVGPLSRPESIEFLGRATYKKIRVEDYGRLAEELGDLPLAMAQAADSMTSGMSIEQYLQSLSSQPLELLNDNKPSGYPEPMAAACARAIKRAGDENPRAVELLRILAFFGQQPIPLETIRMKSPDNEPALPGQLSLSSQSRVLADPVAQGRAIRTIRDCGLADVDSEHDTIRVHKLIQLLVRAGLAADASEEEFRHDARVLRMRAAFLNQGDQRP